MSDVYRAPARPGTRASAALDPSDLSDIGASIGEVFCLGGAGLDTVLAVDPGGTTGWALFGFDPKVFVEGSDVRLLAPGSVRFWTAGELTGPENGQVDALIGLLTAWPDATVVVEDFLLRQFSMDRSLLAPVRITAALSWAMRGTGTAGASRGRGPGRTFILQQPSLAMSTVTDVRMKASGFWLPASGPHARDAVRHALTYARRRKAGVLFGG